MVEMPIHSRDFQARKRRTCGCVVTQYPPITFANTELVLILVSLLNLYIFAELVFVLFIDGVLHLLWLPRWVGEGAGEIDRRLSPWLRELH